MSRTYPFNAWVLTRDYEPKKIELVKPGRLLDRHETATGRMFPEPELFSSKKSAIADGWRRVGIQERAIKESTARLAKRKETLTGLSEEL